MIPDSLLEKFHLYAEMPGGIPKIRESILNLAIRGKLVDQNPEDEPANILLDKIRKHKNQAISSGKMRRQITEPISPQDKPFNLPDLWTWTRLGEIGDWGSGSTPPRGNTELYGGGNTWLKSGELNDNQALMGSEETVTDLALTTCSFRKNQPGDVLLAMYGATIGKVAILAEPAVTNQAVCGCGPFEGVYNRYLFWYLLSRRSQFHEASEGGAQPNISKVKIIGFPFPLPPLAEQKRIVAKVDELMALCDRLEAQQQDREIRHKALARASLERFTEEPTPENVQFIFHPSYAISPSELRKCILTLAIQGKLVPQDPNDKPVIVSKDSQFKEPFEIPKNWAWIQIADLHPEFQNGVSSRGDLDGKPVIVIRLADIEGIRISLENPRIIPISSDQIAKYRLNLGDTLITRVNGSTDIVGTFIPVLESFDAIYCDHFIRMRINTERLFHPYTTLIGESQLVREQIKSLFITTAGQKTVNQKHIQSLWFPLPPIPEQFRIVAKVQQLLGEINNLKTKLNKSKKYAEKIISNMLTNAI